MNELILAVIAVVILCFGFIGGWLLKPRPSVASNCAVLTSAKLWCKKRIHEIPNPHDPNREFFEIALRDIRHRNIRWDIYTPSGLHYETLIAFSNAWEKVKKEKGFNQCNVWYTTR